MSHSQPMHRIFWFMDAESCRSDGMDSTNFTASPRRATRSAVVLVALGAFALGACGSSSKSPAASAKDANTLLSKAMSEHLAGKLADAQKDYTEVIRLDPQNKFAYYNLGLIFQTENRGSDAENQYRLVLTIDGKYEPALYNLALLRTADADNEGAIDLYRRAIVQKPNDANARFNLGLLLRKTGKTADGDLQIQAAVKINPALRNKATAAGVTVQPKS